MTLRNLFLFITTLSIVSLYNMDGANKLLKRKHREKIKPTLVGDFPDFVKSTTEMQEIKPNKPVPFPRNLIKEDVELEIVFERYDDHKTAGTLPELIKITTNKSHKIAFIQLFYDDLKKENYPKDWQKEYLDIKDRNDIVKNVNFARKITDISYDTGAWVLAKYLNQLKQFDNRLQQNQQYSQCEQQLLREGIKISEIRDKEKFE